MATVEEVEAVQVQGESPFDRLDRLVGTLGEDAVRKINAGAGLLHAIYHHPRAKDLLVGEFWTLGMSDAYAEACKAYGINVRHGASIVDEDEE